MEKAWKWGARSGLGTRLFDPKLLAEIGAESYLNLRFREALDEVPHLPGDPQRNRLGRQYDYLTVTRMLDQAINHLSASPRPPGCNCATRSATTGSSPISTTCLWR